MKKNINFKSIFVILFSILILAFSQTIFAVNAQGPANKTDSPRILPNMSIAPKLQVMSPRSIRAIQQKTLCTDVTLTVRKNAPSGTSNLYAGIKEAIDGAATRNLCKITVMIENGIYVGNLNITRPTKLITKGGHSVVLVGSISNLQKHDLFIQRISIQRPTDFGLLQMGGNLTLDNVSIYNTSASADARTGTALELHDGAKGKFTNVTLSNNAGVALYLNGAETKVVAYDLYVNSNKINPTALNELVKDSKYQSRIAAIDVAFGATLLVNRFNFANNEITAVFARNYGNVFLKNGTVSGTLDYKTGDFSSIGGNNVLSLSKSRIELDTFTSKNAKACALRMSNAYLKAQNGDVFGNAIGLCTWEMPEPTYDIIKCMGNTVRFHENGTNYSGQTVPLPDSCSLPNPPASCSAPPNCPGVAWLE